MGKSSNASLPRTRLHRLALEGSWIVFGQVLAMLGSLALIRVLTAHLNTEQYGQLALGLTVSEFIYQTVSGGLAVGIGRFYSVAYDRGELGNYLSASRILLLNASMVVGLVGVFLVLGLLSLGYGQWIGLATAALVLSVFSGYNAALNNIQSAARQRAVVACHTGLGSWLKVGLVITATVCLGNSSTAVVVGFACAAFLITISQLLHLRKTIQANSTVAGDIYGWKEKMWKFSLPFCTFGAFTWMQLASDRWALQLFATKEEVGQYAVLYQLGYLPIALCITILINLIAPVIYQRSGDATSDSRNASAHRLALRATVLSLTMTCICVLLAFGLHEAVCSLLAGPAYSHVSYLMPWLALAAGLFAAGQILATKLMGEMKSSKLTLIKITTALMGVLFNLLGAAYMGIQGVVFAVVLFSLIYFLWMAGASSISSKIKVSQ